MNLQSWQHGVRLGWRQLWRDLRAGQLRLLMLSIALAVAALSAVGFLADRLQAGLWRDAAQLLGGDVVVVSDKPTPETLQTRALEQGLQVNTTLSFPTMARAPAELGGASRLVALKAVSTGYPLRGALAVQRSTEAGQAPVPPAGQVWLDAALLDALTLQPGQTLWLGERGFLISGVIEREPDRGAGFMNFAPRVMLNAVDLPATGLVQPASRITWRMAVAGPAQATAAYAAWARTQAESGAWRGLQVESLESGRPEMRQTLDRASQFLNLVALLAALLCAVAVALAARSFAERQLDSCALLRVLGQSQRTLTLAYATEFLGAGLMASALGVAAGYGVHAGLVRLLEGLIDSQLPAASFLPVSVGLGLGLALLVAFGLPPVLQLAQVPALRVLRRDLGALQWRSGLVLLMGLSGTTLVLVLVSRDLRLAGVTVGGFVLALLWFAAMAGMALWGLRRAALDTRGPRWWRLATRQVAAKPMASVVQVSALSVGLLALVLLVLLRTDLVASWRQASPKDAPDRFVINVQPEQAQDFLAFLHDAGVHSPDWHPMVRGRLVAVNAREVRVGDYASERARRLVDREFNLSYTAQLPAHNPLVAGAWREGETGGASVEQGIAETLGLKLGDVLRFDMGGIAHEARITSLRKVDWASMRANFFVLFPQQEMPSLPRTWLAAFHKPEDHAGFERAMLQRFPNVTSVDLRSSLAQVQRVLDQVTRAVEYLFAFTLAAGVLVLVAAVGAGRQARERDYAILRALGASRALLGQMQRAELLGLGALSGAMAGTVALALGWALTHYVLEFAWTPPVWVPLASALAGALLAWSAGSLSLAGVLRQPVVQTLRSVAE